jgi:hypothetical protein
MKNGTHFWAKVITEDKEKLLMLMKTKDGYYACGAWECSFNKDEFDIIAEVELPEGYSFDNLYYNN